MATILGALLCCQSFKNISVPKSNTEACRRGKEVAEKHPLFQANLPLITESEAVVALNSTSNLASPGSVV